jgi:hopanoid biosynthesis associated protein HpnK
VRRLIINADDFGLTPGVNRAISEAHERGVVTSATLMANGREFEDAAQRARTAPRLSTGCHIVLADGSPVLKPSQVPSLIDRSSANGTRFREAWSSFAWAAISRRLVPEEIEAEAVAQIRRLQAAGITVSHLDTHKHTHLFPHVLRPLLRAVAACGVPALRNPFGPVQLSLLARRPGLCQRWLASATLQGWAQQFRKAVKEADLITPDGTLGVVATGALDERLFAWIVQHIPEGTWEFVCHPGYVDEQLQGVKTRLRESRAQELQVLTSPQARELLSKAGIELISYADLSKATG